MRVYVDGQELIELSGNTDPAFILETVKGKTSQDGRAIMEIQIDGITVDADAFLNVSGGLDARFVTRPMRELVRESLAEALKYVPRLKTGLEEIALHFEKNEIPDGQKKLADAADGLDWVLAVFRDCGALLSIAKETGPGLDELKRSLADSVEAIGALHEKRQYLKMVSLIRRKLTPEIENFRMHIQNLHDFASSTQ